jgi:hypothetical protein
MFYFIPFACARRKVVIQYDNRQAFTREDRAGIEDTNPYHRPLNRRVPSGTHGGVRGRLIASLHLDRPRGKPFDKVAHQRKVQYHKG